MLGQRTLAYPPSKAPGWWQPPFLHRKVGSQAVQLRKVAQAKIRAIEMTRGGPKSSVELLSPSHRILTSAPTLLTPSIIERAKNGTYISPLKDSFQRQHDYLRVSLTERCNLRCFYCMPEDGVELSPSSELLTDDEIIRLARLFVQHGVKKIRLTGGEPTVRKGIVELIARLADLRQFGLQSIGITSNGVALYRKLPSMIENGLTYLNLSLDTLDASKFERITRRKGHDAVLKTLQTALESPHLKRVKLNVVVVKGINDDEVLEFVELARTQALSVRFIEFMPFSGNQWSKDRLIPSAELLSRISERYPTICKVMDEGNDTARSYSIPGFRGSIAFISSMSDHFCATCNRLRITSDGKIKVCLFDGAEISLRDQMRRGATDAELMNIVGYAVGNKKERHEAMEEIDTAANMPMILIGG
ncbi:hypothetical protein FRB99_006467 [Tulasnella sp. 403]|nr:hypothetical protein FRB99_006467 [Tulasnella sp. 403]